MYISKLYKSNSAFLLLDGIDQIEKSELEEFVHILEELLATSRTRSNFKPRMVITARNETNEQGQRSAWWRNIDN
ncbi:Tetratricopeptide-like helical [Penicillium hordei]|uniref:Tetratricopeptide-like helical n=1 Tax=Penicillium hordei TaxID=40994 RepID=A0AAD6GU88_9EURO|nr:Tetratricopeptide-like helical [Penicillium hordei]KAJ5588254.1 Tetratricopeptide-like helical [Penicillium hordei]